MQRKKSSDITGSAGVMASKLAIVIALQVWWSGMPAVYRLGGWRPPLGIALRADGVSSLMLRPSILPARRGCRMPMR
jgi:formate hydrogenlyase subunit 3/multisubunit Na+/H+ antiporter MnhD subunit